MPKYATIRPDLAMVVAARCIRIRDDKKLRGNALAGYRSITSRAWNKLTAHEQARVTALTGMSF